MRRRKTIRTIAGVILLMVTAAGLYIYMEYNRKNKDLKYVNPTYAVTAVTLINEFNNDEKAANAKYLGKVVEVKGNLRVMIIDEGGFCTIVLGDMAGMSSVRCSMDSLHSNEVENISKGSVISVKGVCTGFNADALLGSDIFMNRSVLKN